MIQYQRLGCCVLSCLPLLAAADARFVPRALGEAAVAEVQAFERPAESLLYSTGDYRPSSDNQYPELPGVDTQGEPSYSGMAYQSHTDGPAGSYVDANPARRDEDRPVPVFRPFDLNDVLYFAQRMNEARNLPRDYRVTDPLPYPSRSDWDYGAGMPNSEAYPIYARPAPYPEYGMDYPRYPVQPYQYAPPVYAFPGQGYDPLDEYVPPPDVEYGLGMGAYSNPVAPKGLH